jgi:S-DNA-T family DNA segregation ATPase FtsK/SpoIIIE
VRIERDAHAALDAERLRRCYDCPDPATILSMAAGPRRRLWERRRTDPDYLVLRVSPTPTYKSWRFGRSSVRL